MRHTFHVQPSPDSAPATTHLAQTDTTRETAKGLSPESLYASGGDCLGPWMGIRRSGLRAPQTAPERGPGADILMQRGPTNPNPRKLTLAPPTRSAGILATRPASEPACPPTNVPEGGSPAPLGQLLGVRHDLRGERMARTGEARRRWANFRASVTTWGDERGPDPRLVPLPSLG